MTSWTLARPPDSAQLALGGPQAQLVAEWTPGAQRALDGRYEAPAPSSPAEPATEPPEGGRTGHSVPLRGLSQLTLWPRMKAARELLYGTLFNWQSKCLWVRHEKNASVKIAKSERGGWTQKNLITCRHWTCPNCGVKRARDTMATLGACMKAWLGETCTKARHRDVWMLTLTTQHKRTDDTRTLLDGLYAASEHFFASRTWQSFEEEWGVQARVRVLDATFGGKNGTHPHFHIALFVDGAPRGFRKETRKHRTEYLDGQEHGLLGTDLSLVDAWLDAVGHAGLTVDDHADFHRIAVKVSPSERASAYFTKWGLADEVGGTALKRKSHLTLLDESAAGDDKAGQTFLVWRAAVDGRAWVTGLEKARKLCDVDADDIAAYVEELRAQRDKEHPPKLCAPISAEIRGELWNRAQRVGMDAVHAECERAQAADEDIQRALDLFLWSVVPRESSTNRAPPDG